MILEACVESLEQAHMAEKCGAHRIEICSDLSVGGLTPSPKLVESLVKDLSIPIMVMIRPRPGNFEFNETEMKAMVESIRFCTEVGVHGVVIGNLTATRTIDVDQTATLLSYTKGLAVTFHKAIDETPDLVESVQTLMNLDNIHRILSSGGNQTALEGAGNLRKMIEAGKNKISIISAGRITVSNLNEVHRKVGGKEYHGRRIVF